MSCQSTSTAAGLIIGGGMARTNKHWLPGSGLKYGELTAKAKASGVSPQRIWQKERISEGLCKICGKSPIYRRERCEKCYSKEITKRLLKRTHSPTAIGRALGVSRQRGWQIVNHQHNKCERCGSPAAQGMYCAECRRKARDKQGYTPWHEGGLGRPPQWFQAKENQ